MMSAKTIANIWLDFSSKVIPHVGTTQRAGKIADAACEEVCSPSTPTG